VWQKNLIFFEKKFLVSARSYFPPVLSLRIASRIAMATTSSGAFLIASALGLDAAGRWAWLGDGHGWAMGM